MLCHVFAVLGMKATVIRHEDFVAGAFDAFDLAVVGPGPGDPRDAESPKIARFRAAVDGLLESGKPFLAVCLGHQVLCDRIGIPLAYKDIVFQGTQSTVSIGGRQEPVGFYNTFVGRVPDQLGEGVAVEADRATGDIHLVAGPHYRGVQFHAESILTENGVAILRDLLVELLGPGA
jgi:phenazine biosynthesis protein phzE